MHMKHSFRCVLFLASLSILLLALPSDAGADEPYRVGVALALTGTGAPYCSEAVEGAEMAVNEINAAGGVLGRHSIKLFIRDTQTRPETAKAVTERLIEGLRKAGLADIE